MVVYWTTMAVTGNGELGFDSGEGAWEMATTSKEGSRRVNYQSWFREVVTRNNNSGPFTGLRDCNENNLNHLSRNNWRASLVPAAAVIPAPIAYIKVVAVKKLVVEFLAGAALGFGRCRSQSSVWEAFRPSRGGWCIIQFTLKKLECFRQAIAGIHKHGIME